MTLPDILSNRRQVGPALYLWEYLVCQTRLVDEPWMLCAAGVCVTDERHGFLLDVGAATIRSWRKTLERLGYVRSELVSPRYRKFWLANAYASKRNETLLEAAVPGVVN
jgi:hypothetical protein